MTPTTHNMIDIETVKPGDRCKVHIARQYVEGQIRGGGWRIAEVVSIQHDSNWTKLEVRTRDGVVWSGCHPDCVRAA